MLQPGQVLKDTYRVEQLLGSGGMAEVYLVMHTRLPRPYALKLLHVEIANRYDFTERLRREAEILAKLRNPHVVDAFDWDYTLDGQPYFVMEYLEGETLSAFLHRAGPLSVPVALSICAQIGEGLQAAHDAGVVHRDLKPANIFLDKNGGQPNFVKILDFGIAKVMRGDDNSIMTNAALMGTPGYMAPEQALSKPDQIDQRADQFALAAIFHEMLTGKPAFYTPGDNIYTILDRIVHQTAEPLPHREINRAVQRALSKDPTERFPSLREFLAAVGGNTLTVVDPSSPSLPPKSTSSERNGELTLPRSSKRSSPRFVLLALVGGAVGGGIWMGLPHHAPPGRSVSAAPARPTAVEANVAAEGPPAQPPTPTRPPPAARLAPAGTGVGPANPAFLVSPRPGPAVPGPSRPKTKTPTKAATIRRFVISGVTSAQESFLQQCANKVLGPMAGLPNGTSIMLERSGSLQITAGPMAVRNSELTSCLRQVFLRNRIEIPGSVIINVITSQAR